MSDHTGCRPPLTAWSLLWWELRHAGWAKADRLAHLDTLLRTAKDPS